MADQDNNSAERRKVRATTPEQKRQRDETFVKLIGSGASPPEAAEAVGYSPKSAEKVGYQMKKRLHDEILDVQIGKLQKAAIGASKELVRLALNAEHESVRLKACISILDRALGKTPERIKQETTTVVRDAEKSTEELESELQSILKGEKLEMDGLGDNITLLPGVSPDEALDDWTPPEGFGPDPDDEDEETR